MRKALIAIIVVAVGLVSFSVFAADKEPTAKEKNFVKEAAIGGLGEVQLGQLAQEKAQSQEVKDFAGQMVADHSKANDELKSIAQKKNITVPDKLDKSHQSKIEKLNKASGAEFDKMYMKEMVKDHTKTVADFRKATKDVKDPDLNSFAVKTLPKLEQHLKMAKELAQKVGVK